MVQEGVVVRLRCIVRSWLVDHRLAPRLVGSSVPNGASEIREVYRMPQVPAFPNSRPYRKEGGKIPWWR